MRGRLLLIVLVLLLCGSLTAAATSTANYKDKFESIGWAGSSGSLDWSGPWTEIGDDGDEKEGAVRVVSSGNCASNNCISIDPSLLTNIGVKRTADTSVFQDAELCFDLHIVPGLGLGSSLLIQVNDGSGWVTIDSYGLGSEVIDHPEYDVSDLGSGSFQVRFLVTGLLSTSQVFIDNVEISGSLLEEPTTTTTTQPTTTTTEGDQPTTTRPRPTTTTAQQSDDPDDTSSTTTTSIAETTSTTAPSEEGSLATLAIAVGGGDEPPDSGGPQGPGGVTGGGIRQAGRGLQASFDPGLFGEVGAVSPITGTDFVARFSLGAEVIESTWVWMVLLATVIAWSILSGMERRRSHAAD